MEPHEQITPELIAGVRSWLEQYSEETTEHMRVLRGVAIDMIVGLTQSANPLSDQDVGLHAARAVSHVLDWIEANESVSPEALTRLLFEASQISLVDRDLTEFERILQRIQKNYMVNLDDLRRTCGVIGLACRELTERGPGAINPTLVNQVGFRDVAIKIARDAAGSTGNILFARLIEVLSRFEYPVGGGLAGHMKRTLGSSALHPALPPDLEQATIKILAHLGVIRRKRESRERS